MGYSVRFVADPGGLTPQDAAQLARDGLAIARAPLLEPIHGIARRDGVAVPYTLDMAAVAPERLDVLPEQWAIAAIVGLSFCAPLLHFLG